MSSRKTFLNSEKVKKIIRSLPKELKPKKSTIEEAKDALSIDNLIRSLISYEHDLATEKGNEDKKKKSIASSRSKSDDESEIEDEDMAMIAIKFRKFFKKSTK